MGEYKKTQQSAGMPVQQWAGRKNAVPLQDNRPKALAQQAAKTDIVQRMPGDYRRMQALLNKTIRVSYLEGPAWNSVDGVIGTETDALKVNGTVFRENVINSDKFKIMTMTRRGELKDGDIDFHRPQSPWSKEWDPEGVVTADYNSDEKKELVDLIKRVVELANTKPVELQKIMEHDNVYNMTPEGQLEWCVNTSKGLNAGALAKSLYTSYFYNPINKHLRGGLPTDVDPSILALLTKTIGYLKRETDATPEQAISSERMECQADWIGDKDVGAELSFPAFTSMLPPGKLAADMAGDIGNGTFGKVTKLAKLTFHGKSKVLTPHPGTKYFPNEQEIVLPPGTKAKITGMKTGTMNINGDNKPCEEYHLQIVDPKTT